ncbi:hypothetical protein PV10_01194 [Exophiala mesophila]|uniref:cyclin-dependent kinase n=1 Tax=Exophiala mesophila TaxID=212818 RepID=A0A0D1Y9Z5_EXOME|nr:uncharacterized protein PV10_01194 [Exophiala mesophila]KIV97441.1 hypothetical protein PV10_01194 [Exophiala mesophila]
MAIDLSFSDRLGSIVALTNAFVTSGKDTGTARKSATDLENEIFETAQSGEEYHQKCASHISELESPTTPSPPVETAVEAVPDEILNIEGPTLGAYQYATFHADGQMSTIFKAQAKDPEAAVRIVALKVTHPAMMTPPHNSKREARILALAKHNHVVPLLDSFDEAGGRYVLVFPFLRQDLENLLRSGRLDRRQTSLIFKGLFSALKHVHSLGVIHRDVKPSNILLKTMEGPVYLADFGIAWSPKDVDSEASDEKITDVGTTCYRPPEILFGDHSYDSSLDMWAAGCVVAEMIKADHQPLFDAGALGSELGLIKSIFESLGTPNETIWPSVKRYPDWGKMRFKDFAARSWDDLLPGVTKGAVDFVSRTVCYESTLRLTAHEALDHLFAAELQRP